ncbi:hypothetical protein YS9_2776 [Enterococcus sp. C1]|uniref:hypothetical protein n=1 Tax=Enterococcus sp. C1 TaxID=1182762 RepID=UPI0002721E24|nr:hypothetical protein [Enterococcus sp. C1]EJF48636.1 hypothetical protein YS9_2776 [Enterococcus sp. C1]
MDKRVLVFAQVYMDEDDLHDFYLYEDITEPKLIKNLDTDEDSLSFKSEGKDVTEELWDIEWYRIVPSDSHMANYVRNNDHYDCSWDDYGELETNA